jgi:hypothetical protein
MLYSIGAVGRLIPEYRAPFGGLAALRTPSSGENRDAMSLITKLCALEIRSSIEK